MRLTTGLSRRWIRERGYLLTSKGKPCITWDHHRPDLIAAGIRAMIGKGSRSPAVREAIKRYRAIYFAAIGGVGALLARSIKKAETIAYEDLGPEAIMRLDIKDFPAIVANDIYGEDLFEQSKAEYRREGK